MGLNVPIAGGVNYDMADGPITDKNNVPGLRLNFGLMPADLFHILRSPFLSLALLQAVA